MIRIVQIDHVRPIADLVSALSIGLLIEKFRMLGNERGVGRGVIIDHVDHALHAALVNFIDQMDKVLHRAVFGVDRAIIPVGIGAAEAAFLVQTADGMDGHEPDDIHAQRTDAVEIRLNGAKRALGRVAADIQLIDDAAAQGRIGIDCHIATS